MFDKFSSLEHLHNSFLIAYKGRNKTREVIGYKKNLEANLLNLREKVIFFKYKHRKYKTFIVEDSKKRVINAPSFEDHILHHAIFRFLEEIFDRKFIKNSYANRIGKGSHRAVLKLQKENKKYSWFLKMDITKYFQSVDQEILFKQIKRYIKDEKFLYYVKIIIDSYKETQIPNPLTLNSTGMPIGNVTSQLFANIYLHDLDFYVEHTLKPTIRKKGRNLFYIRYVDDFVFLAENKKDLILIKSVVLEYLEEKLKLMVSSKKLILNKIDSGIPFLGYNILSDRLKIRNDTIRRFKKKTRKHPLDKKINSLISFKGHCDLANPFLIKILTKNSLSSKITKLFKYKKLISILYGTQRGYTERWNQKFQKRCSQN